MHLTIKLSLRVFAVLSFLYPPFLHAADFVFFSHSDIYASTSSSMLYRVNADGTGLLTLESSSPANELYGGVAVDNDAEKVYWTRRYEIDQANFDGSDLQVIIDPAINGGPMSPHRITVNQNDGDLFWNDFAQPAWSPPLPEAIHTANNDGTGITTLLSPGANVWGIDVDEDNDHIFWLENLSVMRSNIDGSSAGVLTSIPSGWPHGLSLDLVNGKVYWGDFSQGIWRSNLDGSVTELILSTTRINDIAVDGEEGKIYYTQQEYINPVTSFGYVKRCNLDGSLVETLVGPLPGIPGALDIFTPAAPATPDCRFHGLYGLTNRVESARDGIQTSDGGFLHVAADTAAPIWYPIVHKTDASGNTTWAYQYHGSDDTQPFAVVELDSTRFAVLGTTDGCCFGSRDAFVMFLNPNGIPSAVFSYGTSTDEYAHDIIQNKDGNIVFAGSTRFNGAGGNHNLWITEITPSGNIVWSHRYPISSAPEHARQIIQTSDGGYAVIGYQGGSPWTFQYILLKVTASGVAQWAANYGTPNQMDIGESLVQLKDRGFILTGTSQDSSFGQNDMLTIRTDDMGMTQWAKNYGWEFWDGGEDILRYASGEFAISASATRPDVNTIGVNASQAWMLHIDINGNPIRSLTYGKGLESVHNESIVRTSDGGFFLLNGASILISDPEQIYAVRTDPIGLTEFDQFCHQVENPGVQDVNRPPAYHQVPTENVADVKQFHLHFKETKMPDELYCTNCVPCPLKFAWASTGEEELEEAYYWVRDEQLPLTAPGKLLSQDFYRVADDVTLALQENPSLIAQLSAQTAQLASYIAALQKGSGKPLAISKSDVANTLSLARSISKTLSPEANEIVSSWLSYAEKDPIGLLETLGVDAYLTK